MLNKVILMGRLVCDPERKYIGDRKVANFTLAVDRGRKNANGEREADFIDCAAWGSSAEFVQKWFAKGMMAIVVGRIQTRHWEDRNGNKRVSVGVQVDEITFGETKKARAGARGDDLVYERPPVDPDALGADDFTALEDDSDVPF
ncbi:single-stranded DNA-binding protein [Butyricicoccus pullicaecorum]|uniref:Single-stranded DNA-binding protein n=1 Tax=Butyricicoccus pullicaecorum TaxID=501571 RepID=A0A1Y4KXI6_9FIRM|nr:single-stranded DNA-binding protein [Butyricicoccus pullicaecorum]OUP49318.1 single-stranded DNA-binding protein [Butyricicoccus pullicaecorum]